MDFDNPKVYLHTSITDGLVFVLLLGWLGRWYISLLNIELLLSHTDDGGGHVEDLGSQL